MERSGAVSVLVASSRLTGFSLWPQEYTQGIGDFGGGEIFNGAGFGDSNYCMESFLKDLSQLSL